MSKNLIESSPDIIKEVRRRFGVYIILTSFFYNFFILKRKRFFIYTSSTYAWIIVVEVAASDRLDPDTRVTQ